MPSNCESSISNTFGLHVVNVHEIRPSNTRKCILSLYADEGRYFGFTELGKVDLESLREEQEIDHRT